MMKGRKSVGLLIAVLCLLSLPSFAQKEYSTKSKKAIKYFEEAIRYYNAKRSQEAIDLLEKAIKADENFIEAHMISGDCYTDLDNLEQAIVEYQKVVDIDAGFFSGSYKQLADAQCNSGRYSEAIGNYKSYLSNKKLNPKIKERAVRSLKNAEFGAKAMENPVPFLPVNLGSSVNTEFHEYYPVLSVDGQTLVFTRNQRRTGARDFQEDFYRSTKSSEGWKQARNFGEPLNTTDNEGGGSITADGSQMFFIGCNRRDGKGSCDIYFSQKRGDTWSRPMNLGSPINTSKWDSQPSISSDGRTLYFSSKRTGGKGFSDLYVSQLAPNGEWTVPRSLGDSINTPEYEESPLIHPDGKTLYFVSNGHLGMGKRDLYVTRMDENGNWGSPVNLGYPINTWNEEYALFVEAGGDIAYFSSGRDGGYGSLDIYSFQLYDDIKPNKVTYVKGKVKDKIFRRPLRAKIELIDLATSDVVFKSVSDKITGDFLVTLPVDHDYALNVSRDGFLFYSEHFSLSRDENTNKPYRLNVELQPIKFGEKVVLKNVFFETASYSLLPESKVELDKLVKFLKTNLTIKVEIGGHTDNVGKPDDNQILSENRAKSVMEYLIANGIDKTRTRYKGYGELQPIDTNDTAEGRANNRRTEFKVLGDE